MNSRKLVTLLSFFVLGLSLWLIARIQQQRQEAEIRTRYYATILGQAPCIENVCPGYSAGRNQALASLSNSSFVEGSEQGDTIIGLFFKSDSGAMMGSGEFISLLIRKSVHWQFAALAFGCTNWI